VNSTSSLDDHLFRLMREAAAQALAEHRCACACTAPQPARADEFAVWLTAREAARYARLSSQVLLRHARTGRLRGEQTSGRNGAWRFHRDWLDEFLSTSARPRTARAA